MRETRRGEPCNIGDRVVELTGQGADTLRATVSFTLPGNVENLLLLGTDDFFCNVPSPA